MTEKILVTGACGQIGTDLVEKLQEKFGKENVFCIDINSPPDFCCEIEKIDVTDNKSVSDFVDKKKITQIYHLASLLSATGEENPDKAWRVNVKGLRIILNLAIKKKIKIFWPSSIAVFGRTTPKDNTPQRTILEPTTIYGVTKLVGEVMSQYYNLKYGVDVRSVRFPGLISYKAEPGGGTTDYAVSIFYDALKKGEYECFVTKDTVLPMMYMDDAVKASIDIMDAPKEKIKIRTSYNLAAISFSAEELANEISKYVKGLNVTYKPDKRQKIADSWPRIIDDSTAREDWGWSHDYDLQKLVKIMLEKLSKKLGVDYNG